MAAAAIIFFAFYGFDAIATAAEETKNPGRDLSIGIVGSMLACVIIYMAVAGAAIGALAYGRFANSPEPLALILREIGQPGGRAISRRLRGGRAADRDPRLLLRPEPHLLRHGARPAAAAGPGAGLGRGTPVRITIFTAIVVAVLAGLIPLSELAALANAGTLTAFIAVAACMLVMRRRAPGAERSSARPSPGWSGRSESSAASISSTACRADADLLPLRPCRRARPLFAYGARRSVAGSGGAQHDSTPRPACPALPRRAGRRPAADAAAAPATVRVLLHTSAGDIIVALETQRAPITAGNFLHYVDTHRLDGTEFYRAMHTGARRRPGPGRGARPAQRLFPPIAHEPTSQTGLSHVDGALSAPRFAVGTARGDFTIMVGAQQYLDAGPARPATASAMRCSAMSSRAWTSSAASSPRRPRRPKARG